MPCIEVGEVADEVKFKMFPLIVIDVPVVVIPCTVAAAEVTVIELVWMNPVLVNAQEIPTVVPLCVPEILMVLPLIVLLFKAGELGPPKLLIAVAVVVPAKPVNVTILFEIVSATSEGAPDVD